MYEFTKFKANVRTNFYITEFHFQIQFFYPRLVRGGIILVHDYHSDGIQKAFKEFLQDNETHLIELTGSQSMIIKD